MKKQLLVFIAFCCCATLSAQHKTYSEIINLQLRD